MSNRMKWLGLLAMALCLSLPLLNGIMETAYNEQGTGVFLWPLGVIMGGFFMLVLIGSGRGRKLSDAPADEIRWDRQN